MGYATDNDGGMMRNFDWKVVYGFLSRDLIWVRLIGIKWGFALKRTSKLFSERNGYQWYLPLPLGWRLMILRAKGA